MIKKSHLLIAICLATLAGILLGACAPKKPAEEVTLRWALLPILDALPIHVAQKEGYFADEGVKVEFIPVSSAAERDQIIAAGQSDGMINDLVSVALYNKQQPQVQTVRFARVAIPETAMYRVLAAKDSAKSIRMLIRPRPSLLKLRSVAVSHPIRHEGLRLSTGAQCQRLEA